MSCLELRRSNFLIACILGIWIIISTSCGSVTPFIAKELKSWEQAKPKDSTVAHTVILIGDAGEPELEEEDEVLSMLRYHTTRDKSRYQAPTDTSAVGGSQDTPRFHANPILGPTRPEPQVVDRSVIFLGDNIYDYGLPPEDDDNREEMEAKLTAQIDAVDTTSSNMFFVPGNHDWNKSRSGGLAAVRRQEQFVENYLNGRDAYLPGNGCAGPVEVTLSDDVILIAIDSEWWLTTHTRPEAPDFGCETESEFDFLVRLEDVVEDNDDKHVIIAMHHPLYSNSNHGGHYSLGDNIFPLRLINEKWMIPLPVIGSLYPLLRKYGVSRQDIPNPKYQDLKEGIDNILEDHPYAVVASGHDHNLQLKVQEGAPHIVSGSASKVNFVARGRKMDFTHQSKGFAKVVYYINGEAWVEFWKPAKDKPGGELTFRTLLYTLETEEEQAEDSVVVRSPVNYSDSTKLMAAGPEYKASSFKRMWLGNHYREVWTTPVRVNYLDMDTEAGGLVPIKKGGGKQTISLRMMGDDEVQYNIRSINKNPEGAVPEIFHGTFAQDLVQDQISSAHPYGAFVIPPLATAADIYHTSPKLFYVPDDMSLGRYRHEFGGMMALFEIRPDEDLSQYRRFGFSENVVSTNTMRQNIREDNDNEVESDRYLRSRIFDMVIGDWDRHEDQWRWAEFEKEGKGSVYSPIPRDRDQVFTKFDGIIPWIVSRRWAQRSLSHFDDEFGDVVGLNLAATSLDRQLLSELDWDEWEETGKFIQDALSDDVIDQAVKEMPDKAVQLTGEEIARKLKSRRDNLQPALRKYYEALSKHVDIAGSENHEYFVVNRLDDGSTDITVFKAQEDGGIEQKIYHRLFDPAVTKEIRIYTLGGEDSVRISGDVSRAIKLRVIGGNDQNTIIDNSRGAPVIVYDNALEDNKVVTSTRTRIKTSDKEYINDYDPQEYHYNYVGPRLSAEFNIDDGLYLGGGIYWNTYGFRKNPYKSEHLVLANAALATSAFNFKYEGTHYSLFGRNWDLALNGELFGPKYVFNYFGTGNGTIQEVNDIDFYRISMNHGRFEPTVNYRFSDKFKVGAGPTFTYYNVKTRPNNITTSLDFDAPEDLTSDEFLGAKLFLDFELVDYAVYPRRGMIWKNQWHYQRERKGGDSFHRLSSDLSLYITPNLPLPVTFATRFGVAANLGSYKFYQSNFLGQSENLRAYRRTRFAGKTAAYQNTEIRIGLSRIRNYFFNGYWGVFGYIDHGRVWTDGEGILSNDWKQGYGPGLWINFFGISVLTLEYGISDEEKLFRINYGMQF